MKLILDDIFDKEMKKYLLSQDGIISVDIEAKDFISEVNVKYNNNVTPLMALKYIDIYQKNDFTTILGFDKEQAYDCNELTYIVDDMCCEYCYKGLIQGLFENEFINSVKSNFDFSKPAFNIELVIKYDKNYDEDELKKYIEEKI